MLAKSTRLPLDAIGLKATTHEGSDDTGRSLAVAARTASLILRP